MTEPTTVSAIPALAAGIGLASLLPGVDGNALVGAFAGATLFVVSAKNLPVWRRLVYLAISGSMGYVAASEVIRWLPIQSTGIAAFLVSAGTVTLGLAFIEGLRSVDLKALLSSWFRRGGKPDGGTPDA